MTKINHSLYDEGRVVTFVSHLLPLNHSLWVRGKRQLTFQTTDSYSVWYSMRWAVHQLAKAHVHCRAQLLPLNIVPLPRSKLPCLTCPGVRLLLSVTQLKISSHRGEFAAISNGKYFYVVLLYWICLTPPTHEQLHEGGTIFKWNHKSRGQFGAIQWLVNA